MRSSTSAVTNSYISHAAPLTWRRTRRRDDALPLAPGNSSRVLLREELASVAESLEHRWGNRFDSGMQAELIAADGRRTEAVIRNVSLSGALVETRAPPPLLSRVSILPRSPAAHWMDAYVVRANLQGVALEWLDPGMAAIHALLGPRKYQRLIGMEGAHDLASHEVHELPRVHSIRS